MQGFRYAIDFCGLKDLGFNGFPFTWCNRRPSEQNVWVRLDRGLATVEWMLQFTTCRIHHLDAFHFDHKPILLISDSEQKMFYRKGRPFRFEAIWLKDNSCKKVVKNSWQEVCDPSLVCLVTKQIINCQDNLRIWKRDTFSHVQLSLAEKLKELKGAEERGLYRSNPAHIHQLQVDIQALCPRKKLCGNNDLVLNG
ncbi:hypothetical protein CFP56_007597 [Quercus suber]|uniref:Uncharacterized protein n=1 Tax=Quercus suber TaxID=58331 RepID=A0AAW0JWC7_QUESU